MSIKDVWFRLRHRHSRSEVVAFGLGLEVGRMLASPEQADRLKKRVEDSY